ncbi:hypothetical protein NCS57_00546800 [Fusarium keratoplasticum]|uniref:Uncharacterized protein n=2 Tax=Fusarium solani species complex TaxID=232080 RepID=A0ACC0QYP5_9HYPO|nr:hypothetical protein NCS57_00546800 [Fusarium keratoplasticum]KAI8670740.1 hypothetical protein NCS57_00546800 [Fusarium keratoplasticum]
MLSESPFVVAPSGVNLSASDQSRSASGGDGFAEHRTAGPTPLQVAIAERRTGIVTATVAGHFAHWQYLTRYRRIDLHATANRRPLAILGLAWGVVYVGVLSTITIAQRNVSRRSDQLLRQSQSQGPSPYARYFGNSASLVTGTAAPILGYGALNALLFVSYNRTEAALNNAFSTSGNLWNTWIAGAVGGLATWVVSTPTELIKCRAQLASPPLSSWAITKQIWRNEGIRGLYFGGVVTALRDSIGYGFYFWSYELSTRWLATEPGEESSFQHEAAKVLLCGGLAGVATWASIFPLDVIKTRVQAQPWVQQAETSPLLQSNGVSRPSRTGALQIAQQAYREEGTRVFFRGLTVCSVRAFMVNAVQWAVYEWVMYELGHGRKQSVSDGMQVELAQT